MVKEDISAWLNAKEQNWKEGLALLVAFSNNKHLCRVFMTRTGSARNMQYLRYELSKLLKASPSPSKKVIHHQVKPQDIKQYPKPVPAQLQPEIGEQITDPVLYQMYKERIAIFKDAQLLFHQLLFQSHQNRKFSAFRILQMHDQIDQLRDKRDYYARFGVLPDTMDVQTSAKLSQRLHTLRTYISRLPKDIANARTEATKLKYQRRLEEYQAEKNDIELKLTS